MEYDYSKNYLIDIDAYFLVCTCFYVFSSRLVLAEFTFMGKTVKIVDDKLK